MSANRRTRKKTQDDKREELKSLGPEILGRSALFYERLSKEELLDQGFTPEALKLVEKELARINPPRKFAASPPPIKALHKFAIIVTKEDEPATEQEVDALPHAVVGAAYLTALTAAGGYQPVVWMAGRYEDDESEKVVDLPPDGLTLNNLGYLQGMVSKEGEYTFAATVTDRLGNEDVLSLTLTAVLPEPVKVTEAESKEAEAVEPEPPAPVRASLLAVPVPDNYAVVVSQQAPPPSPEPERREPSPQVGKQDNKQAASDAVEPTDEQPPVKLT